MLFTHAKNVFILPKHINQILFGHFRIPNSDLKKFVKDLINI